MNNEKELKISQKNIPEEEKKPESEINKTALELSRFVCEISEKEGVRRDAIYHLFDEVLKHLKSKEEITALLEKIISGYKKVESEISNKELRKYYQDKEEIRKFINSIE